MREKIVNFGLFYVGWLLCVGGAAWDRPWLGPLSLPLLLLATRVVSPSLTRELRYLAAVGAAGMALDSLLAAASLVRYEGWLLPAPLAPLWIGSLWVLFATTISRSLAWLSGRPILAAVFGAIGGPFSYYIGVGMGAIEITGPTLVTYGLLAALWAAVVPALPWLYDRLRTEGRASRPGLAAGAIVFVVAVGVWGGEARADGRPDVVPSVDLERYQGLWYEIASMPNMFQKECYGTTATYTLRDDGKMEVLNACRKGSLTSPPETTDGVARVIDEVTNAKLKVRFFWPLDVSYWIIDLCPDYTWAAVGHPSRKYLWIISRSPQLDDGVFDGIVRRAESQGFDVSRLERTAQIVDSARAEGEGGGTREAP